MVGWVERKIVSKNFSNASGFSDPDSRQVFLNPHRCCSYIFDTLLEKVACKFVKRCLIFRSAWREVCLRSVNLATSVPVTQQLEHKSLLHKTNSWQVWKVIQVHTLIYLFFVELRSLSKSTDCFFFFLVNALSFYSIFFFLSIVHEIFFLISGNILVVLGCSMLGLSKSVCWCNLFAMFANTNSCGTMQPLEYFLPPWVVHMSRCGIPRWLQCLFWSKQWKSNIVLYWKPL